MKYNTLNDKQLLILKLTYKFRFITAPLLAQYKGLKSRHSMYITLELLANQGYLLRRKDPTPFNNKGIRYCLAPKALPILRAAGLNEQALHATYKNKKVTEDFIDHQITILKIYLALRNPKFRIFNKAEQYDFEDIIKQKPDLLISRVKTVSNKHNLYFLELLHDQPLFVAKKRLKTVIDYLESDWPDSDYPALLFVLANDRTSQSFQKYAVNILEYEGLDEDLVIESTTLTDLLDKKIVYL